MRCREERERNGQGQQREDGRRRSEDVYDEERESETDRGDRMRDEPASGVAQDLAEGALALEDGERPEPHQEDGEEREEVEDDDREREDQRPAPGVEGDRQR